MSPYVQNNNVYSMLPNSVSLHQIFQSCPRLLLCRLLQRVSAIWVCVKYHLPDSCLLNRQHNLYYLHRCRLSPNERQPINKFRGSALSKQGTSIGAMMPCASLPRPSPSFQPIFRRSWLPLFSAVGACPTAPPESAACLFTFFFFFFLM